MAMLGEIAFVPTVTRARLPIRGFLAFGCALLLLVFARVDAEAAATAQPLNQIHIHGIYTEGEFDAVIAAIDSFTQTHRNFSKDDSIFVAKYLAVIYAANPVTREKGRLYMFRLLDLLPSAKFENMFVSEKIERIFADVKKEHADKRQSLQRKINRKTLYWVGGGVAVAVVAGLGFYLLQAGEDSDRVYDLP